ncbi:hypothetical protein V5799_006110 [Amblyomma americanum]|uniref:Uncharacterized protein n=1 Tax=Amblyomma americanum TaxID=6943 RepID=A0AAQ4DXB6_AMBAM
MTGYCEAEKAAATDRHSNWVTWCPIDLLLAGPVSSAAFPSTMMGESRKVQREIPRAGHHDEEGLKTPG